MKFNEHLQVILILGFICIFLCLFFVPVPDANSELFKTALTALISFISGATINHVFK